MQKLLFLILIISFIPKITAQNYNLPKNAKPGKCYERCFDYHKKVEWKEVECKKSNTFKNKKDVIRFERDRIKMKKYQEKLKKLGYDVEVNGTPDDKTIKAHHKYLRKKKKQEKRRKRAEKRKVK